MNSNRFCKFQTPARQKGSVLILVMVAVATAAVILMRTQFSSRQRMVKADSSLLAFQMEQAFRAQIPSEVWSTLQEINGTAMCADGIRLYWEKLTDHRA